ncbi:A-kinase anchor protein 200 isoform X2 [Dicentrarchus labrax]|uniref:A-kinase anchor protein 200 isoform X2 n=1 Tax=Dicentrarchus labrax TaxID=13489 RepID=UPI0021F57279|nr:A-kinase anchor protein 200 isoform X2 [Dicentrarchus labrax]
MSKDVDRKQVFQTTRVRTSLKNDVSWIQKSNQEDKEEDKARKDDAVETRPVVVRQSSYVLSTAKKFDNSAYRANGEVIPLQKDAQPEGSTVETTDGTKPQVLPEEVIQNDEAQPEKSVANTSAENKEDAAIDQTNVEHNEKATEVSADIHVEEHIQNGEAQQVSSAKENPEAVSPMESAEQPVANTAAKKKGECADIIVDQSNTEHIEVKVSADAHVEDPVAETSATVGTEESKDVPAAPSEPSDETQSANATHLEDAGVESTVQPAEESCGKCPLKQSAEEIAETVAEAQVESSPDKSDVINATPGVESALQDNVAPIPDLVAEPASESPSQPAADPAAAEGSCEIGPPEQAAEEIAEAVAEALVESSPDKIDVINAPSGDEAALQDNVEPVPDLEADIVSELPIQPTAETTVKSLKCNVDSAAESALETRAEEVVESEIQLADNTIVKQSVAPESAADRVDELSIEDAVEPVTALDAEAVQDKLVYRAIELTEALDVEPPTAESAPEPLKDQEQPHTEETKLNQSDDTNISEKFEKPVEEEPQSTQTLNDTRYSRNMCSFCDKIIDGNVKLTFSEPLVKYHPECLKCGVCAKALGDMLTPMFLYNQVIQCDGCFAKTL